MFNSLNIEEAGEQCDDIVEKCKDVTETTMICQNKEFTSCMTAQMLPKGWLCSNAIERLNRELKCRPNVLGVVPDETSVLFPMESIQIEQNNICQNE